MGLELVAVGLEPEFVGLELEDSDFDDSDFDDSDLLLLAEEEEETEDMRHLLMGAESRRTMPTRSTFHAEYDMTP